MKSAFIPRRLLLTTAAGPPALTKGLRTYRARAGALLDELTTRPGVTL